MAGNEILLTCLVAWATDKLPINSNYDMLIHSKIRTTNIFRKFSWEMALQY